MLKRLFLHVFAFGASFCELEALTIANPGFELQVIGDGVFVASATPPTNWSTYDPNAILGEDYNSIGVLNPNTDLYTGGNAPEGQNVALVFLWPQDGADNNKPAGIRQVLSSTLQLNTQYTLTVQVGNIDSVENLPVPAYNLDGFPGYQVQLLAGGVVLALDNNTLAPAEGSFLLSTVQFTTGSSHAQANGALEIRLINLNVPNSGIEVNFDDVQLNAVAVPEPSTVVLISLGMGAVAIAARRTRRSVVAALA